MSSITTLRETLAANLAPLAPDWQISAYILADPTPPMIQIFPSDTTYDLVMRRGLDQVNFTIQAVVALAGGDIGAQQQLDTVMDSSSATSIKALIDGNSADTTLGGLVNTLTVSMMTGPRLTTIAGVAMLVTEWEVILYPDGA